MNNLIKNSGIILLAGFLVTTNYSCKRECPPVVTTHSITEITPTTAVSGGDIKDDCGCDIIAKGVCWATSEYPEIIDNKTIDGQGPGSFASTMTQLTPGTMYFVRAYATNDAGTGYGEQKIFMSGSAVLATVNTLEITSITTTEAKSGGNIVSSGGTTITAKGVCYSISPDPTILDSKTENGTGSDPFISNLTDLCPNQHYYLRAYATNIAGTNYGNQLEFMTQSGIIFNPNPEYGTISDFEGNSYKTLQIGTKTWMAENLRTTKYNDGTDIPLVTDNTTWSALTSPGCCWYDNDNCANKGIYGGLYNWYTVNSGKLCPAGWHVPSLAEYQTLIDYLGGPSVAATKLKEMGTVHWNTPNTGANNESGLTALPGGIRRYNGTFEYKGEFGNWWLSTEASSTEAQRWYMNYLSSLYQDTHDKRYGFSVRCVKD